jgi:hypothetical protein
VQRQEIPNNTPEQVEDYICSALNLVETLDPPSEFRVAVFEQAVALFASKQVVMMQPQPLAGSTVAQLLAGR